MATNNSTIVRKTWLSATNDFQQRIPNPAVNGMARTVDALFSPMNRNYYNQFMDILINRIAFTYAYNKRWDNPLAGFKQGPITYGSTIQEFAPKWIKAHSYNVDVSTLFDPAKPDGMAWYYSTQDFKMVYPIDVSYEALRSAFIDEYGLNQLVASIMTVPMNSDNYDQYRAMVQAIAEYESKWGFFKHQLASAPTDEESGKAFLAAVRAYAGKLTFPSTLYNAGVLEDIPVFAQPSELILLATPETLANVDVYTLAGVFQLDKADIKYRVVQIDEFPIPDAVALLTTTDWFKTFDSLYENQSFYDASTLLNKYYLHHWYGVNTNPFAPAILFTTQAGAVNAVVAQTVSEITVTPQSANADPGDVIQLTVNLAGSLAGTPEGTDTDPFEVRPDSALFAVTAKSAENEPVTLNSRTRVDDLARLHIQKTGLTSGDVITVIATSVYINPSGTTRTYTGSCDVTIN